MTGRSGRVTMSTLPDFPPPLVTDCILKERRRHELLLYPASYSFYNVINVPFSKDCEWKVALQNKTGVKLKTDFGTGTFEINTVGIK